MEEYHVLRTARTVGRPVKYIGVCLTVVEPDDPTLTVEGKNATESRFGNVVELVATGGADELPRGQGGAVHLTEDFVKERIARRLGRQGYALDLSGGLGRGVNEMNLVLRGGAHPMHRRCSAARDRAQVHILLDPSELRAHGVPRQRQTVTRVRRVHADSRFVDQRVILAVDLVEVVMRVGLVE